MTAYSEKELWSPESCGLTTNIFLQCLCVNEGNVPVWFIGWMTAWSLCGHLLWFLGKDSTRIHNVIPIRNWLTKAWHDQTKVRRLDSETNGVMVAHNTFLCGVGNEMQSVLTLDSNKNLINKDMCSPYFSIQDWRTFLVWLWTCYSIPPNTLFFYACSRAVMLVPSSLLGESLTRNKHVHIAHQETSTIILIGHSRLAK